MPISLTCACGAKLEFDDAFAGQVIPCPDCQRPLSTTTPKPPPVAQSDQRTSMLAMTSLFLALAGGFTVIGGLVAAGLGWFAIRKIDLSKGKLGGRNIALSGVIAGGSLTVITLALLFLRGPFGIDGFMRSIEWAGTLDYSTGSTVSQKAGAGVDALFLTMDRPSRFGRVHLRNPDDLKRDDILLYSPNDDAYIVVLSHITKDDEELKDTSDEVKKATRMLEQSDMVRMLATGRIPHQDRTKESIQVPTFFRTDYEHHKRPTRDGQPWDIFPLNISLGRRNQEYTFLIYFTHLKDKGVLLVTAAAAPKSQFQALDSTWRPDKEEGHKLFTPVLQSLTWK